MEEKKLSNLIVSEEKVNEELIYNLLFPYLNILKTEERIIPKDEFLKLRIDNKILTWLLGRKAMVKLKIISTEYAGPKEISEGTMIKLGSVKPTLRSLHKKGVVECDKGKYKISSLGIFNLKEKNEKK